MELLISLSASQKYLWSYPKNKRYEGTLVIIAKDMKVQGRIPLKRGVYKASDVRKRLEPIIGSSYGLYNVLTDDAISVDVGASCQVSSGQVRLKNQYRSLSLSKEFVSFLIANKFLVTEDEFNSM